MEHITTFLVKASDIGLSNNMFGGVILSLIDESAVAYAMQICDTPRIVTIKIDELVFKKPVKVGNILKIYGRVIEFGRTSVTLYVEVRKHNVYTGEQDVVTHTNIKFVKIDDEGKSLPIQSYLKKRYKDRLDKFGRGLLSSEEIKSNLLSESAG